MRRILVHSFAVVGLGLIWLGACAAKNPGVSPGVTAAAPEAKALAEEGTPIRITMVAGECRLLDAHFLKVWSAHGRSVTWKIQGECSNIKEISVGQFSLNGKPLSPIVIRQGARPTTGATIVGTVNKDATTGVYRYIALFDGRPAQVRSLAGEAALDDDGEFEVCPSWPCS